ncbi:MAG TPA: hypothetical protein PLX69_18945 [Leptospiraceae bacterium]|nr:hypothetical protein [Leptospiraceae bacterium]HRG76646.1 hypothetical protein [Leptospiraceae bacterium]
MEQTKVKSILRIMSIILIGYSIANCKTLTVKPGVHERVKKIAVVSVYSPRMIDTRATGFDYLAGFNNSWGKEALDLATAPMIEKIKKGAKLEIIPLEQVRENENYKKLPILETNMVATVSSIGLLPLAANPENDAQFGKLAQELNVDGVMIIGVEQYPRLVRSWQIFKSCVVPMRFIIIEKDGSRGYYQDETFESESSIIYKPIDKMVEGMMVGADEFVNNWITKKIE